MMSGQDPNQTGPNFGMLQQIHPGGQQISGGGQQQQAPQGAGGMNQPQQGGMQSLSPSVAPVAQQRTGVIAKGTLQPPPQAPAAPSSGGGGGGIGGLLKGLSGIADKVSATMNSPVPGPGGASDGGINALPKHSQDQANPAQQAQQGNVGQALGGQFQSQPAPTRMQGVAQNAQIFNNALGEYGMKKNDPTLMNYLAKANPGLDPKSTPWCAGFVGSVLNATGLKGTGSLAARSYLNYGSPTSNPSQGDIVVFKDLTGANNPDHGHVGFVSKIDNQSGMVYTLGGNESGMVTVKPYPISSVIGYRTPPSGQQVAQFAQSKGVNDPARLASATLDHTNKANELMGRNAFDPQDGNMLNMTNNPNMLGQSKMPQSQPMSPQQLQDQFSNHSMPRGIRNNNPGNIESSINAPGQVKGGDPRFAQFNSPQAGLSALSNLLVNKYNNQSLTQIINKYAPPNENDTRGYINTLAKQAGIDPTKPVDMSNVQTRQSIMKGIIQIENGHNPYTQDMLDAATNQQKPANMQDSNASQVSSKQKVALGSEESLVPGYTRIPQNIQTPPSTPSKKPDYSDLDNNVINRG